MFLKDERIDNKVLAPTLLVEKITAWAHQLGFHRVGFTNTDLHTYEPRFNEWLARGFHGEMEYMEKNIEKRLNPNLLVPKTVTIISVTMNYLPPATNIIKNLKNRFQAYISRYALGGDYHKFMRKRLQTLADQISAEIGPFGYRAFTDSAPVLEKALGEKAGLGWIGKNTLLMNKQDGSWFLLGELYTNLPLPTNEIPVVDGCQKCKACVTICPTQAIIAPYILDAKRCISYLTIEYKGVIDESLRRLMGNRIYGCDDCQLICPWNRYAQTTEHDHFTPRHQLHDSSLLSLFLWDEKTFLTYTQGSPIRRIGYERWQRNLAIGLGNAPYADEIVASLHHRYETSTELVKIHIDWAIKEQLKKANHQREQGNAVFEEKFIQALEKLTIP